MRGLNNKIKRTKLYKYVHRERFDIFCCQEMYISPEQCNIWRNEWGGKAYFAPGASNARGVGILISNKCHNPILEVKYDPAGRFVIVKMQLEEDINTCICNIYAPNTDTPLFFLNLIDTIDKLSCENVIIVGDYNLVWNMEIDSYNRNTNNDKSLKVLKEFCEDSNFVDPWRVLHGQTRRYTCYKKNPIKEARLDYFLINQGLMNMVSSADILYSTFSDHNTVKLVIDATKVKRGPGLWRLNTQLLENEEIVATAKNICKMVSNEKHLSCDERWEWLKIKLAEHFQDAGIHRASRKKLNLVKYEKILNELEKEKSNSLDANKIQTSVLEITQKINELEEESAKSTIFRSCARWYREGERSTKYFFSLEKRNYNAKLMNKIFNIEGSLITENADILREQKAFYSNLYCKDDSVKFDIVNTTNKRLSEQQKSMLENRVTKTECHKALLEMADDKAPGTDGLPAEVYKVLWVELSDLLLDVYEYNLETGSLNSSARRGVISLLPKGTKDPRYIKNWRPLTLLNLDYKILAKTLANRMKLVLDTIISEQQTGFMQNRQITENIRKTMDIITYANAKRQRILIISLDFEKCFDRIAYSAIYGSLKYFNFGPLYIKYVSLFFNKFEVCTQNNGYQSEWFTKGRSVNQGCGISPYLFLLCGEVMAHKLLYHPDIKGITLYDVKLLLSQFADDTIIYIYYDEKTVNTVFDTLAWLESHTGLKISYDKTTIYRVGSLKDTDAHCYSNRQLNWSDGDISLLGIQIHNGTPSNRQNYNETITKLKNIANNWSYRKLSLYGKVLLINSLMGSLFVYKMMVMANLNNDQVKKINSILNDFLWNNSRPKIALRTLQNDKRQGGLRLVNFPAKQQSLKLKWIHTLSRTHTFDYAYSFLIPLLGKDIWKVNLSFKDVKNIITLDSFWREVLIEWSRLNYKEIYQGSEVLDQYIWYNSNICIENKPFLFEKWYQAGVKYLKDVIKTDGTFYDHQYLVSKFGSDIKPMQYNQLKSAKPNLYLHLARAEPMIDDSELSYEKVLSMKKPASEIYTFIISKDSRNYMEKSFQWYSKHIEQEIEYTMYMSHFRKLYKITNISGYRDFQYRYLMGRIYSNATLYKWGTVNSENCEFCQEKQSFKHLFWDCKVVRTLWLYLKELMPSDRWSFTNVSNGVVFVPCSDARNLLILHTKRYVFRHKCAGTLPTPLHLKNELIELEKIEYFNAVKQGNQKKYDEKWQAALAQLSFLPKRNQN